MQHDPDFEILVNEIRPQIKELNVTQVQQKFAAGEKFILSRSVKIMNGMQDVFLIQFILDAAF